MPRPMTKDYFAERVHQAREAVGMSKFMSPPATHPEIEMPKSEDIWGLLQVTEEAIRQIRKLTVE